MASGTIQQQQKHILKRLKDSKVTTIALFGSSGVGKTWMARQISSDCINEDLVCRILWISLNKRYDESSLYEDIAHQLSIIPEEYEDSKIKDARQEEGSLELLKQKITVKLRKMRSLKPKKFLLLILDDDRSKLGKEVITKLQELMPSELKSLLKVLITRRNQESSEQRREETEIESSFQEKEEKIEISLSKNELGTLLEEKVKRPIPERIKRDIEGIAEKIKDLTAAVVVLIAEALNHSGDDDLGVLKLESALEEATSYKETDKCIRSLLQYGYDMLPGNDARDMTLVNCCWHSRQFFLKHGGVHYNELIASWILEGYFDPFRHLVEAYVEGHCVLFNLIDRGMLKMQDDDFVLMEEIALTVPDCRRVGYEQTSSLGLASVFEDDNWKGLGIVTPTDDMIKTPCHKERWDKVSTLLIDGSRLCSEVSETFLQQMHGLQALAIFNPNFKSLPSILSKLDKLHMLVVRDCDKLENIDDIRELKSLIVLEISGASSVKIIKDDFFNKMPHLQILNFSALQVQLLPSSLFKLDELRYLILRGCSNLRELPPLKELQKLEVLDLSGSTSFKNIKDKSISCLQKLQMLDLSQTQIDHLPILGKLEVLTRLILRNCKKLTRLCKLESLSALQILDLSGTSALEEIHDKSFGNNICLKILDLSNASQENLPFNFSILHNLEFLDLSDASSCLGQIKDDAFNHLKNLRHLNLSYTNIHNLPSLSSLNNLRQLLLQNNENLQELPLLDALQKLEVLNLSGCSALVVIKDHSFERMTRLQKLDLSETKIECLPSLSTHGNLRQLFLRNCSSLKKLPPLESLSKLEELNLCGARSLSGIETKFLEHMNHLQILNLSEVLLDELPSMSNLIKLTQLILKGCLHLKTLPSLESLAKLEVLDLSKTAIGSLSSLNNCSNLRHLLLRDCSSLKQLPSLISLVHLEVVDLWGTGLKEFPYEITELTHLKKLVLPDSNFQSLELAKIKQLPEELNWFQSGIFKHIEKRPFMLVSGTELSEIWKENPLFWKTCRFSVGPGKEKGKDGDIGWHRVDPMFSEIYFKTLHFPEENGRFLEIFGYDSFPDGVEDALMQAEYISLVDNQFIKSLSDLVAKEAMNVGNVMAMKCCRLERCAKMEEIFCGEETEVRMRKNLEILSVSNLPNLRCVFGGKTQIEAFENLKQLYLDCCPMLEQVFSPSQLPENLEILQVKFCDKLEKVIVADASAKFALQKLHTLHLVELPELVSIGVPHPHLSSMKFKVVKVRECPKLENLEEISKLVNASVENSEIEEFWDKTELEHFHKEIK